MALEWINKVNGADIIDAGDVNSLAHGIIELEGLVADTASTEYVDTAIQNAITTTLSTEV